MLGRVVVVALVGFVAGALVAAEPWKATAVPRLDPASGGVGHDVLLLARLRWLDGVARGVPPRLSAR
jgi:hypothetical protein